MYNIGCKESDNSDKYMGNVDTALVNTLFCLATLVRKKLSDNEHRYHTKSAYRLHVPRNVWKYESLASRRTRAWRDRPGQRYVM